MKVNLTYAVGNMYLHSWPPEAARRTSVFGNATLRVRYFLVTDCGNNFFCAYFGKYVSKYLLTPF